MKFLEKDNAEVVTAPKVKTEKKSSYLVLKTQENVLSPYKVP